MVTNRDDRIHDRIDKLDDKLSAGLDNLHTRLGGKLDTLGQVMHSYDKRLTQVETSQSDCLLKQAKASENKVSAFWRVVAGIVVGLVLSAATAFAAYAAALGVLGL